MPAKRVILELGTGNDLHGGDYTKAALRAVQDALHHSSLAMLRTLEGQSQDRHVRRRHDRRAAARQGRRSRRCARRCRTASSR